MGKFSTCLCWYTHAPLLIATDSSTVARNATVKNTTKSFLADVELATTANSMDNAVSSTVSFQNKTIAPVVASRQDTLTIHAVLIGDLIPGTD